jgi:hypothetical protein
LAKNKQNALNKKYHHKKGIGNKTAMPKWDQVEAGMHAAGITPATDG